MVYVIRTTYIDVVVYTVIEQRGKCLQTHISQYLWKTSRSPLIESTIWDHFLEPKNTLLKTLPTILILGPLNVLQEPRQTVMQHDYSSI